MPTQWHPDNGPGLSGWTEYISQLAWEHHEVPLEELERILYGINIDKSEKL